MKVIETDQDILKVYHDKEDDSIYLVFEHSSHQFTPLEAMQLRDLLSTVIDKTDYFSGLRSSREKQETFVVDDKNIKRFEFDGPSGHLYLRCSYNQVKYYRDEWLKDYLPCPRLYQKFKESIDKYLQENDPAKPSHTA